MDRRIFEIALGPDDLAIQIECCGTDVAEVNVKPFPIGDRRRAGMAVLGMDSRGLAILDEYLLGPVDLAGPGVDAKGLQRIASLLLDRRSQIDLALGNDRRRPAMS